MSTDRRLLRDVATLTSGKYLARSALTATGAPVMGANGPIGRYSTSNTDGDATIVGRVGACGALNYLDEPAWVTDNAIVVRAGESLAPGFLHLSLELVDFAPLISGTTQPLITKTKLSNLEIPVPPMERQLEVLRTTDLASRTLRVATAKLEKLDALLDALREELASEHPLVALGEVLVGIEAGKSPKCPSRPPARDEAGVLKVSAVRPARYVEHEAKVLPDDVAMPAKAEVRAGDLLMTRANTTELVGAVCLVQEPQERRYLCDKTLRLVVDETSLVPAYAQHVLATRGVRSQIEVAATGTSASMKNISQESIKRLRVPVPSPTEQRGVSETLDLLLTERQATEAAVTAIRHLRFALVSELLQAPTELEAPELVAMPA